MFRGELLDYQKDSANKLCARKRLLLALPQGGGKSVISLAATEKLLSLGYISKVLILAPTSISWQWQERIEEFTTNDGQLVEAKNKSSREYGAHRSVYTIVPYSVLRKDYENILPQKYDLVIADEAQEFSSFRSKTFKIIRKFRTPYRWALTGTAISNKLEELYAILQWVDARFLPRWQEFEAAHLIRNPRTKQIVKYKNLDVLYEHLKYRVDRKTLNEIGDSLPELITYKVYVGKDKEVRKSEQNLLSKLNSSNFDNFRFDPEVSKALHEARQALACEGKYDTALDLISICLTESEHNRIVVYSFYKEPIYILERILNERGGCVVFTGDQSSAEKQTNIKLFKEGKARVLLCSDAGKAGLDLPFANYTIHLDVPYSFGTMDQRSKRTQRASSKFKSVVVIYLLVKDSIEEHFYQVTNNKGKLATAALEGGADTVVMKPKTLKAYLEDVRRKDRRVETT